MCTRDEHDENRAATSTPERVTLKIPAGEAARIWRTMDELTSTLAKFQSQMEPVATQLSQTLRQAEKAVRPAVEAARRIERQMEQTKDARLILREAAQAVNAALDETAQSNLQVRMLPAAVASAAETARMFASMRQGLRPLIEATLRTSGAVDPSVTADLVLDGVTRPPSPTAAETEGSSWVVEKLAAHSVPLRAALALLTLLMAARTCKRLDRIEDDQRRILNTQEEVVERLDRIEEEVRTLSDE